MTGSKHSDLLADGKRIASWAPEKPESVHEVLCCAFNQLNAQHAALQAAISLIQDERDSLKEQLEALRDWLHRDPHEPWETDISDFSDEWVAGFLAGQENAQDVIEAALDGSNPASEPKGEPRWSFRGGTWKNLGDCPGCGHDAHSAGMCVVLLEDMQPCACATSNRDPAKEPA